MGSRLTWLPPAIVVVCVALELVAASGTAASGTAASGTIHGAGASTVDQPMIVTAIVGLAMIAVAVSLFWSMGLRREARGIRLVIAVPLLMSVALAVVLMLEAKFRAHAGALGAAVVGRLGGGG